MNKTFYTLTIKSTGKEGWPSLGGGSSRLVICSKIQMCVIHKYVTTLVKLF